MKLEINKIVTLGNNEQYLIVDEITTTILLQA